MAMACFLLVTFFPERPLLRVPRLRSCIAFFTSFWDDLLYFAMSCSFRTFLKVKRTCGMPVIVTRSLRGIAHAVRKCENPAITLHRRERWQGYSVHPRSASNAAAQWKPGLKWTRT